MVAEDFLQDPRSGSGSMASSRPGRCSPSTACRHCAGSDATAITRTANRLVTPIWSSTLSLFCKALRHTPSALIQPPIPVASSHLKSPPRQLPCAPRATGDIGQGVRADWSGASHSRSRTARRERHRRRPRAAACRAIGCSPTKSDLVGCSFKCSPNATALEVRSTLKSA